MEPIANTPEAPQTIIPWKYPEILDALTLLPNPNSQKIFAKRLEGKRQTPKPCRTPREPRMEPEWSTHSGIPIEPVSRAVVHIGTKGWRYTLQQSMPARGLLIFGRRLRA